MFSGQLKDVSYKLPPKPGIYLFRGRGEKILYIGKASNLKSRLSSYLKTEDPRIQKMLSLAKSLEHITTSSDIEALILESQLIKRFRPQFNIVMRDDKQYFYVVFTEEEFPKLFLTHQIGNWKLKTENCFGPFTDGATLKSTLRFLRRIFPYCTCKQLHHNFCLNYHIGKCPGFCCLKDGLEPQGSTLKKFQGRTLDSYRKNITAIKDVLSGKKASLIKNIEKEMQKFAKEEKFEKAIELKEKLGKLERVFENAKIILNSKFIIHNSKNEKRSQNTIKSLAQTLKLRHIPHRIEGYDVSNIQGAHATGSMVTFVHGQPDKNFYRKFKIYTKKTPDDTAMLREIIERRFRHNEWPFPDLILIDGGKSQVNAARAAISNYQGSTLNLQKGRTLRTQKIPVIGISKNERHIGHQLIMPGRKNPLALTKLSPADRNLLLAIDSEAHRFAIGYYRKLHRQLFR